MDSFGAGSNSSRAGTATCKVDMEFHFFMTCYIYARFFVKRFCWMKQVRGENMIFFTLE